LDHLISSSTTIMSLLVPPDYRGPLSTTYVTQVYVPSSLIIAGCAIVKKEWLPFAVAASLVLFGFTFVISRKPLFITITVEAEQLGRAYGIVGQE
jgi:hypothetical protein